MRMLVALVPLFMIWAALHDISRADETNYTAEYVAVGLGIAGLAALYWKVFPTLTPRSRTICLAATAGMLAVLNLSALSARLNPKYPNDAAVGLWFLVAGVPLLVFAGYRLIAKPGRA